MAADTTVETAHGENHVNSEVNGLGEIEAENGGSAGEKKNREAEKRRRRRQKKKKAKQSDQSRGEETVKIEDPDTEEVNESVEVEYVFEAPEINPDAAGAGYEDLLKVFEKFSTQEPKEEEMPAEAEEGPAAKPAEEKGSDSDEDDDDDDKNDKKLSNKERKLRRRMKIAELKQLAPRPDVVEVWDTTAADPKLLVFLKSSRNSVPVPRHWSQKRKYLQGKRGIEKQPFQLPDFIAATGIEKIRQNYVEKEDQKKLKQKQRERMQPKMGKMDIDYQVLHDAFFKFQTKPPLTHHGDVYYEGKEFEVKMREYKPGQLSEELKGALGMTEGAPPPWLINMQRYGPPPSYPHLKIPGLNAPIPEGASFGYHPGGWGKPPVDELGRPIYGDVFGTAQQEEDDFEQEAVDRSKHWGDLEEEEDEEEEEEEEEEEGLQDEEMEAGITSVDSLSTTPTGVETPDVIDLRKAQRKEPEKNLYTVLEEKEERVGAGTLMGSAHTYVVPGAPGAAAAAAAGPGSKKVELIKSQKTDKVDITLRPEELEGLDDYALAAKFEQARQAEKVPEREDFSDMVAQRELQRKRKAQEKEGKAKKQKEFKF